MQGWSWMAALTLVASVSGFLAPTARAAEPPSVKQKVSLVVRLDGVSDAGAEIEIKPAHAGSRFETIKIDTKTHQKKLGDGSVVLDPFEVESFSADHDCTLAITLKETGQTAKTVKRTFRLVPSTDGKPAKAQELICYISSRALEPKVIADKSGKTADEPKRKK